MATVYEMDSFKVIDEYLNKTETAYWSYRDRVLDQQIGHIYAACLLSKSAYSTQGEWEVTVKLASGVFIKMLTTCILCNGSGHSHTTYNTQRHGKVRCGTAKLLDMSKSHSKSK